MMHYHCFTNNVHGIKLIDVHLLIYGSSSISSHKQADDPGVGYFCLDFFPLFEKYRKVAAATIWALNLHGREMPSS